MHSTYRGPFARFFALFVFFGIILASFSLNIPLAQAGTFPGANGKIVFSSQRDGNFEIYSMTEEGFAQTRLTNNVFADDKPSWSHDGTKIVFHSQRDGNYEIYSMDSNGLNQIRLTNNVSDDSSPTWSPDGTKILFTASRDGNAEIYIMDANGSNQTRVTNTASSENGASWSPDGTKIAFHSDRDGNSEIYSMNVNGSNQTRLTNTPETEFFPVWSSDGSKIAFTSDRTNNLEVFVMDASGANQVNISNNPALDYTPTWSPDGTKIAFVSNRAGPSQIYTMNVNGSGIVSLTNSGFPDGFPDWQAIPTHAHLTLVNDVALNEGGTAVATDWTLVATGPTIISGTTGSSAVTNAAVLPGKFTLSQTGGPSGYTRTKFSCSKNGIQLLQSESITLVAGDTARCITINSDLAGNLKVVKVVNNSNIGTKTASDFSFEVTGGTLQFPFQSSFRASGQNNISTGSGYYTITEPVTAGYTASYDNCTNVFLPNGGEVTCTITNTKDAPTTGTLTVHVDFENDNGGTGTSTDVTLKIDGNTMAQDTATTLSPGSHNLEWFYPIPNTYNSTSADCSNSENVIITAGSAKTCTITFKDRSPIVVVSKHVITDNGSTAVARDFNLRMIATNPSLASFTGDEEGRQIFIDVGTFNVTEDAYSGYTASFSADCSGTIGLGETKICTVTNDDKRGTLHIKKVVLNDNGGNKVASDFSFQVNGASATAFEADGQNDLTVNAGTYSVTEPAVSGYTTTYTNCSNVVVANGTEATCTITNNDNAPTTAKLTLVKLVINDSGGTTTASAWTLSAVGPTPISGKTGTAAVTNATVNPGAYTLSETGPGGYTATQYSCVKNAGAAVAGNSITLAANDTATCTITNNDNVPTGTAAIRGTKYEDKFGAGVPLDILLGKKLSGWTIYLDANNNGQLDAGEQSKVTDASGSYAFTGLTAGTYTVREVPQNGWKQTLPNNGKYSVTLTNGQNKTKVDFGNFKLSTVAGTVFEDKNGNKKKDAGEPGLSGWTVTMKQTIGSNSTLTATSDANGNYQFANVGPGLYALTETVKSGWKQTTDNPSPFVMQSGSPVTGQNFGNKKK